eukprot:962601-Ditylum_brightwellii.AAC.1
MSPFAGVNKYVSNKCTANPYITTTSYKPHTKKTFASVTPMIADMKPTAVAHPAIMEGEFTTLMHYTSTQSIMSSEFSSISMPQLSIIHNPITPTPSCVHEIEMQPPPLRKEVFPSGLYYLTHFHICICNILIMEYRCINSKEPLIKGTPIHVHFKNI